jgi:DNA-binding NarL/FixJ family response regulator
MRVLLADQHPEIRLALAILLGKEPGVAIVGSVSEAEGLLALSRTTQPDIVILDSCLPGTPTANLLAALHSYNQHPKILLMGDVPASVIQPYPPDFAAITGKNDSPESLLQKFRALSAGASVWDNGIQFDAGGTI